MRYQVGWELKFAIARFNLWHLARQAEGTPVRF